ncbi:MAG: hypothetical protein LAN84_06530 [Acidobacteriia bacterium]|nr:hypothetical protein [Terriglobia bacterium]
MFSNSVIRLLAAIGAGLALLALPAASCFGAIARVQGCNNVKTSATQTTLTCSLAAAVGAGDLIVVETWWDNTGDTGTVTDSLNPSGNWVSLTVQSIGSTAKVQFWYVPNSASGASDTITLTISPTAAHLSLAAEEYSGVATASPVDVSAQQTGGPSTTPSGPAITTTVANDAVIGACATGGASGTWTAGAGYTLRDSTTRQGNEEQLNVATGSYTPNFTTGNSTSWACTSIAFKPSGGAPPCASFLALRGVGCK